MAEQSQPIPTDDFPCFQRILTFLAHCGLTSYGLRFPWFDEKRYLFYPFTNRYNQSHGGWFEASDETILQQHEHASENANISVGKVFADAIDYNLELDHGYYRLRYALVSTGRQQLICDLLAEKGITQYELIDEVSEGRDLPPYQNFTEIENCSGMVVTLTAVYGFWLGWANGRHTLGEERMLQIDGKERSFWYECPPLPHDDYLGLEVVVEGARQRLHLRRRIDSSTSGGKSEMWELREEMANQFAD
ncbi:hypothetical protein [Dictyobacter formicarum]|uniref:Uncharacterized protein n=1 Tax=Dictyobacter formicarum TaxID=2778368 RepID=A0ABQ3VEN3_9CHLR|nr:hypothetical protein [Dictyobacter formicarum]GHO84382.1 hypothetical protein KSZ_23880 [Dictyobacter formicarum]